MMTSRRTSHAWGQWTETEAVASPDSLQYVRLVWLVVVVAVMVAVVVVVVVTAGAVPKSMGEKR